MKNIIIVTLILCANARASHVSEFANFLDNAIGFHSSSIGNNYVPGFNIQKPKQLVQEEYPEEEPYPLEEDLAPPEEPYVPEEEPYLPEEDPNLPEQPYVPEEEPLLPQEDPNMPEQPFEGEPESW
jgi:hypothetical protein